MRLIPMLALLAVACTQAAAPSAEERSSGRDQVTAKGRPIDGDTVSIDVRLFGADAFEKRQLCRNADGCWQCGKAAQDYASRLLKGGNANITMTGKQSYGRPVGTVTIGGHDLGEAMIEAGFALPATDFLTADPERATRYVAAYDRAVSRHAGAHAGFFIEPAKWRRGERLSCEGRARDDRGDRGR
ncbi:thermonuclease family protein [Sphingomonas lacusdianchii]|uniref:thermonuclease family protein n=1 Tax=Sphingomonas lacusdianchii TaxID=2917992 RepID=UPI001F569AEB|nr:thermonuclease family protein [Sphingomonas sp. JXJ CY 53]